MTRRLQFCNLAPKTDTRAEAPLHFAILLGRAGVERADFALSQARICVLFREATRSSSRFRTRSVDCASLDLAKAKK